MRHSHATEHVSGHTDRTAPQTEGRVIEWAHGYDPLVKLITLGRDGALRKSVIRAAAIKQGSSVLDVGCGTGDLTRRAKRQAGDEGHVYGIDPSQKMIEVAQSKADDAGLEINFQLGVIEELAFADETFDVVLSSLMFHHLPDALKRKGLAEIHRVLKPGGRLVIADLQRPIGVNGTILKHLMLHGKLERWVTDLIPLMQEAGYTEIDTGNLSMPMLSFVRAHVPNHR